MDAIGDILVAILELFVRLLYGVIRLIIRIIALVLSHTWLVNHFAGLRLFGWWLAFVMSCYLVFGILRALFEPLWTPGLTAIYQWEFIAAAVLLLLIGIAMREFDAANFVPDNTNFKFEPDRPVASKEAPPKDTGPIQSQSTVHSAGIVAALVLVALLVGIVSAFSSERHEATLAEKLCEQADARISDGVEQTVRDGAGLFDRVFGTQTADRIPCADD